MAKLTDSDVASMRSAYDTGQHSYRSLSEMYGVSVGAVQRVIDGSAWSHIPLCENRFDYVGERHRDSKLTESDVRLIRKLYTPGVYGFKRLAKQFGINIRSVRKVVEHKTWKHVV